MCLSWIHHLLETKGIKTAYNAACDEIRKQKAEIDALWYSRFFKRVTLDDGTKKLWPCTEQEISRRYDMAYDNDETPPPYFYCDDNGELQPVTVGKTEPQAGYYDDYSVVVASAYLIANGETVGTVIYTDH